MTVIGWTGAWDNIVPTVTFTAERKKALVERIRKRRYNFNHFDHEMLGCAPVYDDKVMCVLTKAQFDDVMCEVYKDIPTACCQDHEAVRPLLHHQWDDAPAILRGEHGNHSSPGNLREPGNR